jgi:hypothetical protein
VVEMVPEAFPAFMFLIKLAHHRGFGPWK